MTWLAVKTVLAKVWAWCKIHWELLLGLAVGLGMLVIFYKRDAPDALDSVVKIWTDAREKSRTELEQIDEGYRKRVKLEEEAQARADAAMRKIEEEYERKKVVLDRATRKRAAEIVEESKRDPEKLAKEMAALLGVEYIP